MELAICFYGPPRFRKKKAIDLHRLRNAKDITGNTSIAMYCHNSIKRIYKLIFNSDIFAENIISGVMLYVVLTYFTKT